ncbi:MAG: HAD-IA family hydrolase [Chthoniobacterales bacterium]
MRIHTTPSAREEPNRARESINALFKAIFFDAAGTLFHLPKGVGYHYALVGEKIGVVLDAKELERAFAETWKAMPGRPATVGPRDDDDKGWWRQLVDRMLADAAPNMRELDRDNFFEIAYEHFAEAGVWELHEEVHEVLEALHSRWPLAIVSNFDGRLRMILAQLGISKYFGAVFLSSELGADKPDPLIYRRALALSGFAAEHVLHVGDDPERDWRGAAAAGLSVFELERPRVSLRDLLAMMEMPLA